MHYDIRDEKLAEQGILKIEWASWHMPVLREIAERFSQERPFLGLKIGASLHITSETANLLKALKAGGAEVALCGANPLSTRDEISASLVVHEEIPTFAFFGETREEYYRHMRDILSFKP
ncbi:MAG: adenosylhomocysteinase, partial [Candidatus Tectomicrobia bacterium]|nr:adenosylhomocysteinase [Candidatus Tectomicrobia bacterium]